MKTTSWICWLLAACVCFSEAKHKIVRRPLSPPYAATLILKKPRPIDQRISMGNIIHIGAGSLSHQRTPYKHANYRIRWPIYNVLSTNWKSQIPTRAVSLNNRSIFPQRAPTKEFYSTNILPEYSPEYRPELIALPSTHRGSANDDKGPIHTIPAPNLNPADEPPLRYNTVNTANTATNLKDVADHRLYSSDFNYHTPTQNPKGTTFGLATISNGLSSREQQRTAMSSIPPQRNNQYQVTESNDATLKKRKIVQPAIFPQDLDITRLYSIIINNPQPSQSNELFANHPVNSDTSVIGSNVDFGQSNMPMQTNLRSTLNIGSFPSTDVPQAPYTGIAQDLSTDLHVGHPAPAGPPLSASQLYSLLNNFPHQLTERYTTDQQHIFQQQQPGQTLESDATPSFSQPQMHSFNYDEQSNQLQQRQQQQILPDQDYAFESVTADHNPESESSIRKQDDNVHSNDELTYPIAGTEQSENNIEYGEMTYPTTYFDVFDKTVDDNVAVSPISARFYTTLPNREAAEKLAALAAAGNVNSRLIGQLRKQQKKVPEDEAMPFNHKNDDGDVVIQHSEIIRSQVDGDQLQKYHQPKSDQKISHYQQYRHGQSYSVRNDEKSPLQITVPDESDYITSDDDQSSVRKNDVGGIEYEYEYENESENEDRKVEDVQSQTTLLDRKTMLHDNDSHIEFGSRLRS